MTAVTTVTAVTACDRCDRLSPLVTAVTLAILFRIGGDRVVSQPRRRWGEPDRRHRLGHPGQEEVHRRSVPGVHHGKHNQDRRAIFWVRERSGARNKSEKKK